MIKQIKINQSELTSECWLIQFRGLEACENCKVRDTPECGGQEIRHRLVNEKGFKVPLRDVTNEENCKD